MFRQNNLFRTLAISGIVFAVMRMMRSPNRRNGMMRLAGGQGMGLGKMMRRFTRMAGNLRMLPMMGAGRK